MSGAVDESCQLLVVAIDINPNQLLFARQPGRVKPSSNSSPHKKFFVDNNYHLQKLSAPTQ
jgi:hypothetical protein